MKKVQRAAILALFFYLGVTSCGKPDPFQLVDIKTIDATIVVELPYATPHNFLGKAVYEDSRCFLRRCAAERLARVQTRLRAQGYGLKVWDGYRPLSVQKAMWAILPDANYVADPARGSRHNRGAAVDVTLVRRDGADVEMPTAFDDFSPRAAAFSQEGTQAAKEHRRILQQAMTAEGFQTIDSEWWHFDDPEWKKCEILDISGKNL